MYLASKAGRNYHELLPSLAGQTYPNAAVNMPGTTCVEHHGWIAPCQVMGCNPGCPDSGAGREHHIAADGAAAWGCLSRESGVALLLLLSLP